MIGTPYARDSNSREQTRHESQTMALVVIGGHMRRSLIGGLLAVVATCLPLLVSSASAVAASSASRAVDRKTAGGTEGLRHSYR